MKEQANICAYKKKHQHNKSDWWIKEEWQNW
jgi:hypothetical protein